MRIGYRPRTTADLSLTLGDAQDVAIVLGRLVVSLGTVTVTAEGSRFSSTRTGVATAVARQALEALPNHLATHR